MKDLFAAIQKGRDQGKMESIDFRAKHGWDEFFVSAPLAKRAHLFANTDSPPLELFKMSPQDMNWFVGR